jgi:GNAT superfamily N-acetyltransferase
MSQITITFLEMTDPAQLRRQPSPDPRFEVREVELPQWQLNRFLYNVVGERWGWTDKLQWSEAQWKDYVTSGCLRTFVAFLGGNIAGYYELQRDKSDAVEIIYFGLMPEYIGHGYGGALLTDAIERAWSWKAKRVWVHTATHDHPAALKNYEARGMTIYDRQTEQRA